MTAAPIRVVLAEDHELFREGITALFLREPVITVLGVAGDGSEVLAVSRQPDVVLLDVEMPGPPASATTLTILRELPSARALVLTMHRDAVLRRELLDAGVSAYLTKAAPSRDLAQARSNRSIAEELSITEGTAKRHANNI